MEARRILEGNSVWSLKDVESKNLNTQNKEMRVEYNSKGEA